MFRSDSNAFLEFQEEQATLSVNIAESKMDNVLEKEILSALVKLEDGVLVSKDK